MLIAPEINLTKKKIVLELKKKMEAEEQFDENAEETQSGGHE